MKTANGNVIKALEVALQGARAGRLAAVAIITVTNDGVPDVIFGGDTELIPSVNFGADLLKARLVGQVMHATELKTTSIVHPAAGVAN